MYTYIYIYTHIERDVHIYIYIYCHAGRLVARILVGDVERVVERVSDEVDDGDYLRQAFNTIQHNIIIQ